MVTHMATPNMAEQPQQPTLQLTPGEKFFKYFQHEVTGLSICRDSPVRLI